MQQTANTYTLQCFVNSTNSDKGIINVTTENVPGQSETLHRDVTLQVLT